MHHFVYRRGHLFCEDVPVRRLAEKFGTPLYVYSRQTIIDHYCRLDAALAPLEHGICYAVKANANLAVLRTLVNLGSGFDVVSAGELFRVIKAGGDPRACVFAGVGKTEDEIRYALGQGISCFNVESVPEIARIQKIAARLKKRAPIALRVNPDVEAETHKKITTGTYENKFGISFEEVEELYASAAKLRNLHLRGVQMHIGSQITSVKPFVHAVRKMTPLVRRLKARYGIETFSVGGGIGIVYDPALESGAAKWWDRAGSHNTKRKTQGAKSAQRPLDDEPLPLTAGEYAAALVPLLKPIGLRVLVEPGRFIVGNAGMLLTRVEYVKTTAHRKFVVVDAAMNDLIRPALYEAYHEIVPLRRASRGGRTMRADIVGPVCESGDFLAQDRDIAAAQEGDYLAVLSAGAYGFSMASNYNSRRRAAEVLVSGGRWAVVRKRETAEELMSGESSPAWV